MYSATSRSFGEWMFASGSATPVRSVGMPAFTSAGTIGNVPPERISAGRMPNVRSNTSSASSIAGARPVERHRTRTPPTARPRLRRPLAPLPDQPLERGAIVHPLTRREPDRDVRLRDAGSTVFWSCGLAADDAVDVDRRLGPGADVELLGGVAVGRPRSLVGQLLRRRGEAATSPRPRSASAVRCPRAAARVLGRPAARRRPAPASARASRSAQRRRRARVQVTRRRCGRGRGSRRDLGSRC